MSRAVGNPHVGPYLQERLKKMLAEGWKQVEIAKKADISTPQVSDVINKAAGVGYATATKLGRLLGFANLGELETAAETWVVQSGRMRARTEPPSRRPQRLLSQRDEWAQVSREAQAQRPYLSPDSIERVGRLQDNDVDYPVPLPVSLVCDLAHAFFAVHSQRQIKKQ